MTCDASNRYQLLLFNYVHFSKEFCINSWDKISLKDTYSIFADEEPLSISLSCTGILSGRYKVTQFSLNRNYGSSLDKYLRILDKGNTTSKELLSTIMNFTEDEAEYYRRTSVPRQDIYYTSCDDTLQLKATLEPHEIQFYEFSRLI